METYTSMFVLDGSEKIVSYSMPKGINDRQKVGETVARTAEGWGPQNVTVISRNIKGNSEQLHLIIAEHLGMGGEDDFKFMLFRTRS